MHDLIVGTLGSLVAALIIIGTGRTRAATVVFSAAYGLALKIRQEGLTRFHFSRDDYRSTLRSYLSQAKHSIAIASISLVHKEDESELTDFFRQRLAQNPNFEITISLMAPDSAAVDLSAKSLNMRAETLQSDIERMLRKLFILKRSLAKNQQSRLHILVHDALPMGSAILLDATQMTGIIQVETKLFRAPCNESFGFEIQALSRFYDNHFRAWSAFLRESRPPSMNHIIEDKANA